jgi:uncharacterized membrane protein (DUF485 family)
LAFPAPQEHAMHGPSSDWGEDHASSFKTRVGIWMFILYAVIYAGFVLINTVSPEVMASDIGSLNLAVIYGFGLLLFALMLAVVYNAICTAAEEAFAEAREPEGPLVDEHAMHETIDEVMTEEGPTEMQGGSA